MVCRDFRDWIDLLDQEGELVRLREEISLEPDVGAIGRAICDLEGPGVIAENIVGVKIPMALCLHASWRRPALAMGLPKNASPQQQVQAWLEAYDRYPVKAKVVNEWRIRGLDPAKARIVPLLNVNTNLRLGVNDLMNLSHAKAKGQTI